MKFTAEFTVKASCGTMIATADTVEKLMDKMVERGFTRALFDMNIIERFKNSNACRCYGYSYTLQRGETQKTEYTSV